MHVSYALPGTKSTKASHRKSVAFVKVTGGGEKKNIYIVAATISSPF
jgi:hypothetical protein